jgi:hypothetical protein
MCIVKAPIICGREPTASEEEKKLGTERAAELSAVVNQVMFSSWHENCKSQLYHLMIERQLYQHLSLLSS